MSRRIIKKDTVFDFLKNRLVAVYNELRTDGTIPQGSTV